MPVASPPGSGARSSRRTLSRPIEQAAPREHRADAVELGDALVLVVGDDDPPRRRPLDAVAAHALADQAAIPLLRVRRAPPVAVLGRRVHLAGQQVAPSDRIATEGDDVADVPEHGPAARGRPPQAVGRRGGEQAAVLPRELVAAARVGGIGPVVDDVGAEPDRQAARVRELAMRAEEADAVLRLQVADAGPRGVDGGVVPHAEPLRPRIAEHADVRLEAPVLGRGHDRARQARGRVDHPPQVPLAGDEPRIEEQVDPRRQGPRGRPLPRGRRHAGHAQQGRHRPEAIFQELSASGPHRHVPGS